MKFDSADYLTFILCFIRKVLFNKCYIVVIGTVIVVINIYLIKFVLGAIVWRLFMLIELLFFGVRP